MSQKASKLQINKTVEAATEKVMAKIKEANEYAASLRTELTGANKKLDEFKVLINDEIENQFQILSKKEKKHNSQKQQGVGASSLTAEAVDNMKRMLS